MCALDSFQDERNQESIYQRGYCPTDKSSVTSTERTNDLQQGVKDVITLFHSPSNPASTRVHTLLKQLNATSQAHATEDQASDHGSQSKLERTDFELGTC